MMGIVPRRRCPPALGIATPIEIERRSRSSQTFSVCSIMTRTVTGHLPRTTYGLLHFPFARLTYIALFIFTFLRHFEKGPNCCYLRLSLLWNIAVFRRALHELSLPYFPATC